MYVLEVEHNKWNVIIHSNFFFFFSQMIKASSFPLFELGKESDNIKGITNNNKQKTLEDKYSKTQRSGFAIQPIHRR